MSVLVLWGFAAAEAQAVSSLGNLSMRLEAAIGSS